MKTFNLPDLGEGLPEAEIVEWHVKEGDRINADDPMVSVETAKAVVEVPAPYSGVITKLYAAPGDLVQTGKPLVDFDDGAASSAAQRPNDKTASGDSGTVVGSVRSSDEVLVETAIAGGRARRRKGRVKAAPAVRALAKRLGVDLSEVKPTGKNGLVTANDVESHVVKAAAKARPSQPLPAAGQSEPLRGPRRAMAQSMSAYRDQAAGCTLFDDADINAWLGDQDFTGRMLRALVAGCREEPALNALFDGETMTRQLMDRIDAAIAIDTPDGLIVPVMRDVAAKEPDEIRREINRLKKAARDRTIPPADMQNYTITLSNFGTMAGRYATPLMVPPTVAILGTGKLQHDVVPVLGGIEVHPRIPLSLTFDHRCVTGGEACRFLAAVIQDLALAR